MWVNLSSRLYPTLAIPFVRLAENDGGGFDGGVYCGGGAFEFEFAPVLELELLL